MSNNAKHTPADPMDQVVVYLTASGQGVGQRLGLDTIDKRLRNLPLRQSLLTLSEMCFKTERASASPLDDEAQIEMARDVCPTEFLPRAIEVLKHRQPPCVVLSPQVLVLLGIRLMAISSDDNPEMPVEVLGRILGGLCLAFGDHIDQGPLNEKTTILEVLRLQLFYGQSQHPGWLSLTGRLFFDVLPGLTEHPAWCDPLTRFHSGTGAHSGALLGDQFGGRHCGIAFRRSLPVPSEHRGTSDFGRGSGLLAGSDGNVNR